MELPAPFGKYHLLERLAVGGMAEIFLAKVFGAAGFERILVIKKILPHMAEDQEFITMFIDEARIASTLNHSNIVQINELGREGSSYFIAMEYVHGKDLSRVIAAAGQRNIAIPIPLAVLIASRICEALDYAHRRTDASGRSLNIIHRDVSPGNVLISYDGEAKLIDFGIAKAANRVGRTTAGTLKGKFGYMSPEQVRGLPLDRRSDIFSVGIILYEMLTAERLFGGESDFGTLEKVRNAVVKPPSIYNDKIPKDLERTVMRSLAKESEERYERAADLQEDLLRFQTYDGSLVSGKSLAAFMSELFSSDITAENERLATYRRRGCPWLDASRPLAPFSAQPTLVLGDGGIQRPETAAAGGEVTTGETAIVNEALLAEIQCPGLKREWPRPRQPDGRLSGAGKGGGTAAPFGRARLAHCGRRRRIVGTVAAVVVGLIVALLVSSLILFGKGGYPQRSNPHGGERQYRSPRPETPTAAPPAAPVQEALAGGPPSADLPAIMIMSDPPEAEILLDGQKLGNTPMTIGGLQPKKKYFLVLKKEGYKPFFKEVKFAGRKKVSVEGVMEPGPATASAYGNNP